MPWRSSVGTIATMRWRGRGTDWLSRSSRPFHYSQASTKISLSPLELSDRMFYTSRTIASVSYRLP
jgi:hypothetical protein